MLIFLILNLNNFRFLMLRLNQFGDEKVKSKLLDTFNVSFLRLDLLLKINKIFNKAFILIFILLFGLFRLCLFRSSFSRLYVYQSTGFLPNNSSLLFLSSSIGALSGLIGMWLDMEDNKKLQG